MKTPVGITLSKQHENGMISCHYLKSITLTPLVVLLVVYTYNYVVLYNCGG